jgi:chromosome segregation ATPase
MQENQEDIEELKNEILWLKAQLAEEKVAREDLVEKLDQCAQFAVGLKKQRDDAIKLTEQILEAAQKQEKKIVLPGHLDSNGKARLIP